MLASPKGGRPPVDPKSSEPEFQTGLTRRFEVDAAANAQLDATVRLDSISARNFDAAFYSGGHGTMWDLAEDLASIALIESFVARSKPVAFVGHSVAALRHVTVDRKSFVQGKKVTGCTNTEEEAAGLANVVPFFVEDELKARGGVFFKVADWQPYVVRDGLLTTGQNPASSGPCALALLEALKPRT